MDAFSREERDDPRANEPVEEIIDDGGIDTIVTEEPSRLHSSGLSSCLNLSLTSKRHNSKIRNYTTRTTVSAQQALKNIKSTGRRRICFTAYYIIESRQSRREDKGRKHHQIWIEQ
jgi:hypothetical protein